MEDDEEDDHQLVQPWKTCKPMNGSRKRRADVAQDIPLEHQSQPVSGHSEQEATATVTELQEELQEDPQSGRPGRPAKKPKLEVAAVLFVPRTHESNLAGLIRKEEQTIAQQSGYMVKVVERAGQKLADVLVKSDPFGGGDCGREKCYPCLTKHL